LLDSFLAKLALRGERPAVDDLERLLRLLFSQSKNPSEDANTASLAPGMVFV
jgi:hypothetical protein